MPKFICDHPWTHFEVNNPNGDVTMCCDNATVLGNVHQGTVEEIWNGERFEAIRADMRDKGAHAICPHTCPVLHGNKTYQKLDWFAELEPEGPARRNAELNEGEFKAGKLKLESLPRWMRFAYSYACNLDCYHCYQREDATTKQKLPDSFMDQVRRLSKVFQAIFPFGGEPFLFKPVLDFVETADIDSGCRYYFVTNATLLTDRVFAMLRARKLGLIAVSLDAATADSFEVLRKRGRKADWDEVVANLGKLKELKAEKGFIFTVSMTVNKVNHAEIESFVDLALAVDAEPLLSLVANPYQTYGFQRAYLSFTEDELLGMHGQIERSLVKVRARAMGEAERALNVLRGLLSEHAQGENRLWYFTAKRWARSAFHCLPGILQRPARAAVQAVRVRKLATRMARRS